MNLEDVTSVSEDQLRRQQEAMDRLEGELEVDNTIQCTVNNIQCTVYSACTVYTIPYSVQRIMYSV